jgi:hypothetical protein
VIRHGFPIGCEAKSGLSVNEAPNQPGRSHSIDAWPRPRNPEAPLKRRHPSRGACFGWGWRSARTGNPVLELTKHGEDTIASRAAEEVDLLGRNQTLTEDVEQTAERWRPRALRSPRAARALQRLFDVTREFVVDFLSHSPELLDERIVGPGIDVVGREDRCITSSRLDFGLQPLEILSCIGRIGKGIYGLFQRNRTDLLEPSPGRDSEVRRLRGQLMDEQQPAAMVRRRCRGWQPNSL